MGAGVMKNDVQASFWWSKAAEQGKDSAQFNLGNCYNNGIGVPKDPAKAIFWWRKAAEQGNPKAQYNLGVRYLNGEVVAKDVVEGYAYWAIAVTTDEDVREELASLEKELTPAQIAAGRKRANELKVEIEVKMSSTKSK
jgi:TPR repeat protein